MESPELIKGLALQVNIFCMSMISRRGHVLEYLASIASNTFSSHSYKSCLSLLEAKGNLMRAKHARIYREARV